VPPFDLTVDDTLDLVTVNGHSWNTDGSRLGFLRTADGDTTFASQSVDGVGSTAVELTDGTFDPETHLDRPVSAFEWRPGHPDEVLVVSEGDLYSVDAATGETEPFVTTPEPCGSPVWHPDGDRVAYIHDGVLWVHHVDGTVRTLTSDTGFGPADLFGPTPLDWDADGDYLALVVETEAESLGIAVYDVADGTLAWSSTPDRTDDYFMADFEWVGAEHLVYAEDATTGDERIYRSVHIGTDADDGVAIASDSVDGLLLPHSPVGTDSGQLALVSARTGYRHVYAIDVHRRRDAVADERPGLAGEGVHQVTSGEFEARGDADDQPTWGPDGERLAYVTNEADPGERHLEVATLDDGTVTDQKRFDEVSGNAVYPKWAPESERIACLRSGRYTPTDIHVADAGTDAITRVTASHPDPDLFESFPEPEPVSFESDDGATVYGYLYLPPGADEGDDYSSVVLCHGGPIAQMRRGFHHGRTYGHFHFFDQYLVSEGYAVLELNFRSGIGYGDAFEQAIHRNVGVVEVEDCVAAAGYLRDRAETNDSVGMWGRSYGGFLANVLATKTDAYDCTVNVAGIWDWRTWEEWAIELGPTNWGAGEASWFHNRFGGAPDSDDETVQERYRVASPNTYVDEMDTPLLALHGSADKNVTVEELTRLTEECVEAGVEFDPVYYPDEEHMFEDPATWRDALDRVTTFYEQHL